MVFLRGRPFRGVGFLWHKSLNSYVECLSSSADGRVVAHKLHVNKHSILLFNLYFPCFNYSVAYKNELTSLCGFIENVLMSNSYDAVLMLGDNNFDIVRGHIGFDILNNILQSADLCACDYLIDNGAVIHTYVNTALQSASRIDHIFISNFLHPCIQCVKVIDSGANNSDHRPVQCVLNFSVAWHDLNVLTAPNCTSIKNNNQYKLRWDKGNLTLL